MGDPETQPIMMRLKTDFPFCWTPRWTVACIRCRPTGIGVRRSGSSLPPRATRTTRARATPSPGLPVDTEDCITFHAATAQQDGQLVTAGGRVLCVTALGDTVSAAQRRAYEGVAQVDFPGMLFRRDIGHRALRSF
jgi:phosphoribosylamine---glycine ligase